MDQDHVRDGMKRGVYKRGNVYWLRYANKAGKMMFESSRSSDFREAERLLLSRKQCNIDISEAEIRIAENDILLDLLTSLADRIHDNSEILDCISKVKQYCTDEMAVNDTLF